MPKPKVPIDKNEASVRGQLAVNARWKNTKAAEDNRRTLRAIKAEKLMQQAHELLYGKAESE